MTVSNERINEVKPELRERICGGWLAISPRWARFTVGVTAQTEQEARDRFRSVFQRWVSIVDDTPQENT